MTADGYVVVNKLKSTSRTITIEVPQNSLGDWFLRRWARWQKNSKDPSRVALGTLTVQDTAGGFSIVCTGVTLQKVPDRVFDRTATNLVYTLDDLLDVVELIRVRRENEKRAAQAAPG